MKKIIYVVFVTIILAACAQTKEHKAEILIKESLKKVLYKPETYKAVDTQITEAFSPDDDPDFIIEVKKLVNIATELGFLDSQKKDAQKKMALWSDSFTKVGKSEYQEAKEKYDETSAKIEKLTKKGKDIYEKVTSMLQSKPVFVGYKAVHNYRAETNDGTAWIGNTVYFFDKDFKQLIYEIELDEYNQTKEFINDLKHRN